MYINELWIKAMNKLKDDKSKFSSDDTSKLDDFLDEYEGYIPANMIYQIARDIEIYKKYDAIAMWVGDGGLIYHEPEFIKELVKIFDVE